MRLDRVLKAWIVLISIIVGPFLSASAFSQGLARWEVERLEGGMECLATAEFEVGDALGITLWSESGAPRMLLLISTRNKAARALPPSSSGIVGFDGGRNIILVGAETEDGLIGIYPPNDAQFLRQLAHRRTIHLSLGGFEASYSLAGTFDAIERLTECVDRVVPIDFELEVRAADHGREEPEAGELAEPESSTGTGFFISSRGYLVTSAHVVSGYDSLIVGNADWELDAELVAIDEDNDLALLKVDARTPALPLRSGNTLRQGEEVIVLGYPVVDLQGLNLRSTFGRINSLFDWDGNNAYFQIDAPISPGSSGGPVLSTDGSVIGVVAAQIVSPELYERTGVWSENVSFAVRASLIKDLLPSSILLDTNALGGDVPDIVASASSAVVVVLAD